MKYLKLTSLTLALLLIFAFTACGNANSTKSTQSGDNNGSNSVSIKEGSDHLLASAQDLKKAIDSGDNNQVKKLGPELEDKWSVYEDQVKPKYPDLYAKVEKYLDPAIAGSKASTIDKKTLESLVVNLISAVKQLRDKSAK